MYICIKCIYYRAPLTNMLNQLCVLDIRRGERGSGKFVLLKHESEKWLTVLCNNSLQINKHKISHSLHYLLQTQFFRSSMIDLFSF